MTKITIYTDKVYGGRFTYDEMVEDAKVNYDYGDPTNFRTYMEDWWQDYYRVLKIVEREENIMTREMIIAELKNRGYEVLSADVTKNGVKLQGIAIGKGTIRPTIYVDDLLNRTLDEAVNKIIDIYKNAQKNPVQFNPKDIMKWNFIKTRLQLCLQRKGDEDIVKRDFLDLEEYIRVIVDIDANGTGSFKVQPSHLTMWGITEDMLFNAAWDCTKPTITETDTSKVMAEMMGITLEELLKRMGDMPMQIILSNHKGVNGAIAMKDTWLLSEIANRYKSDLAILPSSIHECIVMPIDESIRFDELNAMVREVNKTELVPEEQLSDHAYRFNRNTGKITYYNREEVTLTLEERVKKVLKWVEKQNDFIMLLKVSVLIDMYKEYKNDCGVTYEEIDKLIKEWEKDI